MNREGPIVYSEIRWKLVKSRRLLNTDKGHLTCYKGKKWSKNV